MRLTVWVGFGSGRCGTVSVRVGKEFWWGKGSGVGVGGGVGGLWVWGDIHTFIV